MCFITNRKGRLCFQKRVSVILFTLYDVVSCLAARSHVPSRGVSVPGPMSGGLYPGGSLSGGGGLCERGVSVKGDG